MFSYVLLFICFQYFVLFLIIPVRLRESRRAAVAEVDRALWARRVCVWEWMQSWYLMDIQFEVGVVFWRLWELDDVSGKSWGIRLVRVLQAVESSMIRKVRVWESVWQSSRSILRVQETPIDVVCGSCRPASALAADPLPHLPPTPRPLPPTLNNSLVFRGRE